MRKPLLSAAFCTLCALGAATPSRAETAVSTTGTAAPLPPLSWGRLQGRLAFATDATPLGSSPQSSETAFKVSSLSLMGDYYLRPSLNQLTLGGFRATSGLLFGQRSALWGMSSTQTVPFGVDRRQTAYDGGREDHATTPYVGLGYTGTGVKGNWGFSADLGVMSLNSGTGRFGKGFGGSQNLDDLVRDLRLTPVLQLGFTYSF